MAPTHKGATVRNRAGVTGRAFYRTWRVPSNAARALELRRKREVEAIRRTKQQLLTTPLKKLAAMCRKRGLRGGRTKADRAKWRKPTTKMHALLKLRRQLPYNGSKVLAHLRSPKVKCGKTKKRTDSSKLPLTLMGKPFDAMVTGEKREEFRAASRFIKSRLMHPDGSAKLYNQVEFTNGYGHHRPRFYAEYFGFSVKSKVNRKYKNGLVVNTRKKTYVLHLGRIQKKANMHRWYGPNGKRGMERKRQ